MLLGLSFKNLILGGLFVLLLILYIFPSDMFLIRVRGVNIKKIQLFGIILILIFLILYFLKIASVLNVLAILFIFLSLLSGFSVDRKYLIIIALLFLGLTIVFYILKLSSLAYHFSILCFLSMIFVVIKDLFYEKIFKN